MFLYNPQPSVQEGNPGSQGKAVPAELPWAAMLQLVLYSRAQEGRWPCLLIVIKDTSIPLRLC